MENLNFKTNINCSGCVQTVKPHLDNLSEVEKWDVDLENPAKVLSVKAKKDAEGAIKQAVKTAGYQTSKIK